MNLEKSCLIPCLRYMIIQNFKFLVPAVLPVHSSQFFISNEQLSSFMCVVYVFKKWEFCVK